MPKKSAKKNTITMTLQFDLSDNAETFGKFCKVLAEGGFAKEMKAVGAALRAKLETLGRKA